ncbi:MAG: adenine glycosylase [Eggerthellaceae bacterium]|nr:adenine glycosylase [Eggerthellaceae bacterium]
MPKTQTDSSSSRSVIVLTEERISSFRKKVLEEGKALYRDFPWRKQSDPYKVLVSEIMLQQTQTVRVLRYFERFIERFPTIDALSSASVSDVLEAWQGLGYNRRALMLKKCADECSLRYRGVLPSTYEELIKLPGIGPSTAAGVMVFAHGVAAVYLETNVRSVYIREFFEGQSDVSDKEIIALIKQTCPETDVDVWYCALLDLGAHIKTTEQNYSRQSKTYAKQSTYEGSDRQLRAEIIRMVLSAPEGMGISAVVDGISAFERKKNRGPVGEERIRKLLTRLEREGFLFLEDAGTVFCADSSR